MSKKTRKNNSGFTLAELIVVIAIIGILAAIVTPAMMSYFRQAKLDTANANAKQIYTVVNQYSQRCINLGAKLPSTSLQRFTISDPGSTTIAPVPDHLFEGANATPAQCAMAVRVAVNVGADKDLQGTRYWLSIDAYGRVDGVIWYQKEGDPYVGGYPNEATTINWTLDDARN